MTALRVAAQKIADSATPMRIWIGADGSRITAGVSRGILPILLELPGLNRLNPIPSLPRCANLHGLAQGTGVSEEPMHDKANAAEGVALDHVKPREASPTAGCSGK